MTAFWDELFVNPKCSPKLNLVQKFVQIEQRQHLLVADDEDQLELVVQLVLDGQRAGLVQVAASGFLLETSHRKFKELEKALVV